MGQYACIFSRPRGEDYLETHIEDDDPLVLFQGYDSFAVLTGKRNYCSIVPLFEPFRPWPAFLEEMKKFKEVDKVASESQWESHFHTYHPEAWITPEDIRALDLDRPLEFLEPKKVLGESLLHRLKSLQPGDTYRTFIERETHLMPWFEAILKADPEFVVIAYD